MDDIANLEKQSDSPLSEAEGDDDDVLSLFEFEDEQFESDLFNAEEEETQAQPKRIKLNRNEPVQENGRLEKVVASFKIPKLQPNDTAPKIVSPHKIVVRIRRDDKRQVVDRPQQKARTSVKDRLGTRADRPPSSAVRQEPIASTSKESSPPPQQQKQQSEELVRRANRLMEEHVTSNPIPRGRNETAHCKAVLTKEFELPEFVRNPTLNQPAFSFLFGEVCRGYLHGQCQKSTSGCQLLHFLPNNDIIRSKLILIGQEKAVELYDVFLLRSAKLFNRYFPYFAEYFAAEKLEPILVQMIGDCSHPARRMQIFFIEIVNGLCAIGIRFSDAVQSIIDNISNQSIPNLNAILNLILNERNDDFEKFNDFINNLALHQRYIFAPESVNKLLRTFIETKNSSLFMMIWTILTKYPESQTPQLDTELFARFASISNRSIDDVEKKAQSEPAPDAE